MPIPPGALDGLSDDLVFRLFLHAPFETHGTLHVVCRRLKTLLRSREFRKQRVDSGLAEYGLVVAGGVRNGTGSIADCSVFTCGRWRSITPLSGPRMTACSAIVEDEDGQPEMWVMGGVDGGNVVLATVEAYNPRTNTWRSCLPLSLRRMNAVAGVVGGRLVVAGGRASVGRLTSVEAYTPTGWIPLPHLPHAANAATACVLNGRLYVMGGLDCNKLQVLEMSEENEFTWTVKAELPSSRFDAASAAVDGKLWLIGGTANWLASNSVLIYDIDADSWVTGPSLPRATYGVRAAALNGEVLVIPADTAAGARGHYAVIPGNWVFRGAAWVDVPGGRAAVLSASAPILLG